MATKKECHDYHRRIRLEAIYNYGNKCEHCGESQIEFLVIDHINDDGAEHRRKIGSGKIYRWLKKNNYPFGFQVLCNNCNRLKETVRRNKIISTKNKNMAQHKYVKKIKNTVFSNYNNKCQCCGKQDIDLLCIHHINKGGSKLYNKLGGGVQFWKWIIKNNFPKEFKILCYNCNCSYQYYGYCPHNHG